MSEKPLVILVHGIRDIARWQTTIIDTLERNGFDVEPTSYGRMNLLEFLVPFPFFRSSAIAKVWNQIQYAQSLHPGVDPSIIAHSFGTYIIAYILRKRFTLRVDKIIFCGSVVPYTFPFEQINDRFSAPILNEVGTADPWPAVAESLTTGYGSAGTYGFKRPGVRDRFHNRAHHEYFLSSTFCEKFWVPFLRSGERVPGSIPPDNPARWVRLISIFKIKYFILLAVMLVLAQGFGGAYGERILCNTIYERDRLAHHC